MKHILTKSISLLRHLGIIELVASMNSPLSTPGRVRMMMRIFVFLALVGICLFQPALADETKTIAIMNFTNRSPTAEWDWLRKGLADMLITDLSEAKELQIVEREKLQKFLEEMKLAEVGLIEPSTARQLGNVAKVEVVLFGSFLKERNRLEIEAHLIDVDTGDLLRVEWVRGRAKDVFKLEKALAFKIVKNLHVKLTRAERESIRYEPTDSISAATRFYIAQDLYDKGKYSSAFAEVKTALKKAPGYVEARSWLATLYSYQQEFGHALIELKRILREAPNHRLADNVCFKIGKIYEREFQQYEEAVKFYQKLVIDYEGSKLALASLYQIGGCYRKMEDYKKALEIYQKIRDYYEEFKPPGQNWELITWKAIEEAMAESYRRTGQLVAPPMGVINLDLENPVYSEDYATAKLFEDAARWSGDVSRGSQIGSGEPDSGYLGSGNVLYIFKAPDGYQIEKVDTRIIGQGRQSLSGPRFGLAVEAYPEPVFKPTVWWMKSDRDNISGSSAKITQERSVHFPMGTVAFSVRVEAYQSKLYGWSVRANLSPLPDYGSLEVSSSPANATIFLGGVKVGRTPARLPCVSSGDHFVQVYKFGYATRGKKVKMDKEEALKFNFSLEELKAKAWTPAIPVAENLEVEEYQPALIQDKRERLWLVFSAKEAKERL